MAKQKRSLPAGMAADMKTAASLSGYNTHYFRRMCKTGRIEATQRGRSFFFTEAQLEAITATKVTPSVKDIFEGLA